MPKKADFDSHWDIATFGDTHPKYAVRMSVFGTSKLAGALSG